MHFIPLPFVVAILLVIVFVVVVRREEDDTALNLPFLGLILLAAFQSVLLGVRWGYEVNRIGPILAIVAAIIPPLVYAGVRGLTRNADPPFVLRIAQHLAPAAGIALLIAFWQDAVDISIALVSSGYAIAILLLMRRGADALDFMSFENTNVAYRAILYSASALLLSAGMDVFIFFDFEWTRGAHTPQLVTIANLALLAALSLAAAATGRRSTPTQMNATAAKPRQRRKRRKLSPLCGL